MFISAGSLAISFKELNRFVFMSQDPRIIWGISEIIDKD